MTITTISSQKAQQKQSNGAILIDIRDYDEFQREHIQNAICIPFEQLNKEGLPKEQKKQEIIFYCKSGGRTQSCQQQLAQLATGCEVFILDGGLNAWQSANFPIMKNKTAPLPIMRQVQIAAGSLILFSMLLGSTLHPLFYLVATFVGMGLVFAGISGFCGMAILLNKMPWNK